MSSDHLSLYDAATSAPRQAWKWLDVVFFPPAPDGAGVLEGIVFASPQVRREERCRTCGYTFAALYYPQRGVIRAQHVCVERGGLYHYHTPPRTGVIPNPRALLVGACRWCAGHPDAICRSAELDVGDIEIVCFCHGSPAERGWLWIWRGEAGETDISLKSCCDSYVLRSPDALVVASFERDDEGYYFFELTEQGRELAALRVRQALASIAETPA